MGAIDESLVWDRSDPSASLSAPCDNCASRLRAAAAQPLGGNMATDRLVQWRRSLSLPAVGSDHYPIDEEIINESDAAFYRAMIRPGIIRRIG